MRKHLFVTLLLTCGLPSGYSFSAYAEPVPQTQNQNVATITGTILDEKSNGRDAGGNAKCTGNVSAAMKRMFVKIPENNFSFQKIVLTLARNPHIVRNANYEPIPKALKNRNIIKF